MVEANGFRGRCGRAAPALCVVAQGLRYWVVPAPLPDEPGVEPLGCDGTLDGEPGGMLDGLFSLGLLGAELLPVPYGAVLLTPLLPIDPGLPLAGLLGLPGSRVRSSVVPGAVEPGVAVLGLPGVAVPLGGFTPPPIVPVLVAPELVEPVLVPAWATSRHPPNEEVAVAAEARAAVSTDTTAGCA